MSSPHFAQVRADSGFDGSASPPNPWLMVPHGGVKHVRLLNAASLPVTLSSTAQATVRELTASTEADRRFELRGVARGTTHLLVTNGRRQVADLEVAVKLGKTVRITWNYVKDNAGHHTRRSPGDETPWIPAINRILTPQANVAISSVLSRWVTVPRDLGRVVRWARGMPGVPASQHEWDAVVALRDPGADLNVFFVWEYEQDRTPLVDNTDAGTMGGNCLFEDHAGSDIPETLAHEIGHHLGCGHNRVRRMLMYPTTDVRGKQIPKADATTMNPS